MNVPDLRGVRGVTFDVGGTLLRPHPSVGAVYAAVAAAHGCGGLDATELDRRFTAAWRRAGGLDRPTRTAWGRLVDEVFTGLVAAPPTASGLFDALYRRFAGPDCWREVPGARAALEATAAAGFRLAVLSNWDERLRPLLGTLGLDRRFDALVISAEVGFGKPAPEIFAAAAGALRLAPDELLHVGDSPREDGEGARQAGWRHWLLAPETAEPWRPWREALAGRRGGGFSPASGGLIAVRPD